MCKNLKNLFFCTRLNFLKWWRNPTIISLLLCWTLITVEECKWLLQFCNTFDAYITPWFVSFGSGSLLSSLLYTAFLTILFAHAPFCNQHSTFTLVRTGKLFWFLGQVLYILLASMVTVLFTYGVMLITLLPRLGWSLEWGGVLQTLAEGTAPLAEYGITSKFGISLEMMQLYSPIQATVYSFLMQWATSALIGCIVLFFNIVLRPGAGIVAAFMVVTWSYFTLFGFLLVGHANLLQYTGILFWQSLKSLHPLTTMAPTLPVAASVIVGLILFFTAFSTVWFCKKDTQFEKDRF